MKTGEFTVIASQTAAKVRLRGAVSTSDPLATIPVAERWVWKNNEVMQSLTRGKQDVRAGRVFDLGSFAQYADLDIDD